MANFHLVSSGALMPALGQDYAQGPEASKRVSMEDFRGY